VGEQARAAQQLVIDDPVRPGDGDIEARQLLAAKAGLHEGDITGELSPRRTVDPERPGTLPIGGLT